MKHDLYCKGPFPDGRMGECWVKVGTLELKRKPIPARDFHVYRCSACARAEKVMRPYVEADSIPWYDPDYRVAVIEALAVAASVFPFIKVADATERFCPELKMAVEVALAPLLTERSVPRNAEARRIDFTRAVLVGSGYRVLDSRKSVLFV